MHIEWSESYRSGDASLDASLQGLFALGRQIADLDDWIALRPLIVRLYKQMQSHFALEDALLQRLDEPARVAHAAQHEAFLRRLEDRSMDVGKGHMNKGAILAVMQDWAQNHVPGADAALTRQLAALP